MDEIILQNSYRNHGSYPIYTLGASIGHVDDDMRTFYTIVRQYNDHDIVVNVYDSLDRAFGVYKCLVDVDTLTLPVPEQETHTA